MKKRKLYKTIFWLIIFLILLYNPLSARLYTLMSAIFFHLDVDLFYHTIQAESSFRSLAISKQKAIGLGQMKISTADYIQPKWGKIFVWIPPLNTYLSAKYMNYLLQKYNQNWSVALAAYNWGETNVDRRMKKKTIDPQKNYHFLFSDIPETSFYLQKILSKK